MLTRYQKSPFYTIKQFVECYDYKEESLSFLKMLLAAALPSAKAEEWTDTEKADIIFFVEDLQALLGSVYVMSSPLIELFDLSKLKN